MAVDTLAKKTKQNFVFANNHDARLVCGTNDANLALIEQDLAVNILMRGNSLRLIGTTSQVEKAKQTLNRLYELVKKKHVLDLAETKGVLAVVKATPSFPQSSVDNIFPNSEAPMSQSLKGDNMRVSQAAQKTTDTKNKALKDKPAANFAQISTYKKTIYARTPTQTAYIKAMQKAQLVFGIGPAGTGKTYLAVAYAASLLEAGLVERIILSRPAVEAGERLGFLPGDMKEKVDPYLRPLYDALYDMMPAEKVERALLAGIIEIAPLAFMRGRTLAHSAIILDEAQNTTSMQMKMLLTRLGEGSHMIINGDPSQIDLPIGQQSGLVEATELLHDVEHITLVKFSDKDVVRHPLVAAIIRAYAQNSWKTQHNLLQSGEVNKGLEGEIKAEVQAKEQSKS